MGKKKTGLITDEVRELINEVARETAWPILTAWAAK